MRQFNKSYIMRECITNYLFTQNFEILSPYPLLCQLVFKVGATEKLNTHF